jgi:predicted amidohydrolase
MRIALAQAAGTPGDVRANLADVERLATEAAARGARLVVFPEAFVTGYNIGAGRLAELAEPADGPSTRRVAAIAQAAGIAIVTGYAERDGDAVYNSAILVDRDGSTKANHRKLHLWGALDKDAFTAGDALAVTDVDGVRIGLLVCYDIEFPEAARALAVKGAHLIAVPTALMEPAIEIAELLPPARALENQVFVAYANRIGDEGDLHYVGRSCVAGPTGAVTRAPRDVETLLLADVDPEAIEAARSRTHYLADRRPRGYDAT